MNLWDYIVKFAGSTLFFLIKVFVVVACAWFVGLFILIQFLKWGWL